MINVVEDEVTSIKELLKEQLEKKTCRGVGMISLYICFPAYL